MNKKLFILPIALFALTLGACEGLGKPKEPKFEKYANVVTYEQFVDAVNEEPFIKRMDEDYKPESHTLKIEQMGISETASKIVKGKEESVLLSEKTYAKAEQTNTYDQGSTLIKVKGSSNTTYEVKQNTTSQATMKYTIKSKTDQMFLEGKVDGEDVVIGTDALDKTYWSLGKVVENLNSIAEYAEGQYLAPLMDLIGIMMSYESSTEDEQKKYAFYKDDSLYTAVYADSETNDIKDLDNNVVGKEVDSTELKVQMKFADKKIVTKTLKKDNYKEEFTKEAYGYEAGYTYTKDETDGRTYTFEIKSQSLSAPNYTSYRKISASAKPISL